MCNSLMKRSLLLLSCRPWNKTLPSRLSEALNAEVRIISSPDKLTFSEVSSLNPDWIFVTHWSYLIPESIWSMWPTVIFHMTDLPYGRGGSPLQNLIERGHEMTMISALRCGKGLDTGDVYLKKPLSLCGSAEEIFLRADVVIENMIKYIVCNEPTAIPQEGEPVVFSRRTPDKSNLALCPEGDLSSWYDLIRMLDADGYPHAYLELNGIRIEFRRVSHRTDGLYADVRILPAS